MLAKVGDLNIFNAKEDECSSVNHRSTIITVTNSDIIGEKWTIIRGNISFLIIYIQVDLKDYIHSIINSGVGRLKRKLQSACGYG